MGGVCKHFPDHDLCMLRSQVLCDCGSKKNATIFLFFPQNIAMHAAIFNFIAMRLQEQVNVTNIFLIIHKILLATCSSENKTALISSQHANMLIFVKEQLRLMEMSIIFAGMWSNTNTEQIEKKIPLNFMQIQPIIVEISLPPYSPKAKTK